MLRDIARELFDTYTQDVDSGILKINQLNVLMKHPNWNKLQPYDLIMIMSSGTYGSNYSYEFIYQLSKHPNWNNLLPKHLIEIAQSYGFETCRRDLISLLSSHPHWNSVSKNLMVQTAVDASLRDDLSFLYRIPIHPTWEAFTKEDLLQIVSMSYYNSDFAEIKSILSKHRLWKNIEPELDKFIEEKRKK